MKLFFLTSLTAAFVAGLGSSIRADEADAKAVLDKALKALGGETKLVRGEAFSRKGKGTISFGGNDNEFASATTVQGLDRYQSEFEGDFDGIKRATKVDAKRDGENSLKQEFTEFKVLDKADPKAFAEPE